MSRGQVRLHLAKEHEDRVKERLVELGWAVSSYGQGAFCDDVRQALVDYRPVAHWRWMPDLIAARGPRVALIDAKADESVTPNFSIEVAAYMAHLTMRGLGLPIFYVWADMTCNTPHGLRVLRWELEPQRGLNRGSGTPFALVAKADQHPFDWAFGHESARKAS